MQKIITIGSSRIFKQKLRKCSSTSSLTHRFDLHTAPELLDGTLSVLHTVHATNHTTERTQHTVVQGLILGGLVSVLFALRLLIMQQLRNKEEEILQENN